MELRAPRREEAERVLQLLAARDIADLGAPDVTLGDLIDGWGSPEFDLERDATVCESAEGEIVGYAVVQSGGSFGATSPSHEGEGIGTALLDWMGRRQRELGWDRLRTGFPANVDQARQLVASHGYELVRSYWRMVISLEDRPEGDAYAPPQGITFRCPDLEADGHAIYELDRVAFASVAGTEHESEVAFADEHLGAHDLATDLSTVAERNGRIVGFALIRRWDAEATGYVDILAVSPVEQGHGLGRTLLLCSFEAIGAAGLATAALGVAGDNPRALRLYESVGMRPRFQFDVYERDAG